MTYGRVFGEACEAVGILNKCGINAAVLKLNRIRPIDEKAVEAAMKAERIYFFEEGVRTGGVGEKLAATLLEKGFKGSYSLSAVEDCFVRQSSVSQLLSQYGLDGESIANKVKTLRGV